MRNESDGYNDNQKGIGRKQITEGKAGIAIGYPGGSSGAMQMPRNGASGQGSPRNDF